MKIYRKRLSAKTSKFTSRHFRVCSMAIPRLVSLSLPPQNPPISQRDRISEEMDLSDIARKLDLYDSKHVIRRAAELRRLCDIQFDSSIFGVGEVCKAVICLDIAATRSGLLFDRKKAITLSGMSEKAYTGCYNSMQNGLGVKWVFHFSFGSSDFDELAIQFGCVRIIRFVQKALSLYKTRFLASLPASRRASADFTRPVFIAVAFYVCAKHKLKVDKLKLIELCGASETEFSSVSTSMKDLCFDVCGIEKEKKDPKDVKGNRELLDVLPEKRKLEDGGYSSDEGTEPSSYKRHKKIEKRAYEGWRTSVLTSNRETKAKVLCKRTRQTSLNLLKDVHVHIFRHMHLLQNLVCFSIFSHCLHQKMDPGDADCQQLEQLLLVLF
ncbi:origin of replication complex subunit 6-like isoform X6 [Malus sylvestris]|uniref:origin of replication complex subunit 6-like isoform X6 n=1 Tax=Malus sylvestris TaxID=3752 RepID=UPI0021ACE320|nr:origin of replication complex subunit 6-like isoform X6 [Malus sylvestris]